MMERTDYVERRGIPSPGFSDRLDEPEIVAACKKNKRISKIAGLVIIPLPFIGIVIYSLVSDKMEVGQGVIYGAVVSAIFLLCSLVSLVKGRASNTYEGVVIDQKSQHHERSDAHSAYTEYVTVVRTDDGKKKKIRERDNGYYRAYTYLNVGDRFKYHPQFPFPYEHFDKSKAPYICCVSCGTKNEVQNDRCEKCGIPLLK